MDQQPEETNLPLNNMNETSPVKKGFPAKTLILIIVLALVAFGLVLLALINNKNPNSPKAQAPISQSPAVTDPVQTVLTISSSPVKISSLSAYSDEVIINTGQDQVNKVQLEIAYDPKVLLNVDITPGTFFTNPQIFLKNIDPVTGRISFALGVQNGENGILGQGVLAKLNFTTFVKSATTSVTLLPKTQVSADGYSQSVLKSSVNGFFSFTSSPKASVSGK